MILVLSDGIRGHIHQSLGLVNALSLPYEVISVRWKKGTIRRIIETKRLLQAFSHSDRSFFVSWIEKNVRMDRVYNLPVDVVVSAGSKVAPVNLALSKITGARSVVCMIPEHIPTSFFDVVVAPEHDVKEKIKDNFIVSIGAINNIKLGPPLSERPNMVSVLVGGNDINYKLSLSWANGFVDNVLRFVEELGAELWVTTSRRTDVRVAEFLFERFSEYSRLKDIVLAHRTDRNPVPEMLYLSRVVITTEDSVAMVSESASSGAIVFVSRVVRRNSPKRWIDILLGKGVKKFDSFLKSLESRNYIRLLPYGNWAGYALSIVNSSREIRVLREAERIASILLKRLNLY